MKFNIIFGTNNYDKRVIQPKKRVSQHTEHMHLEDKDSKCESHIDFVEQELIGENNQLNPIQTLEGNIKEEIAQAVEAMVEAKNNDEYDQVSKIQYTSESSYVPTVK